MEITDLPMSKENESSLSNLKLKYPALFIYSGLPWLTNEPKFEVSGREIVVTTTMEGIGYKIKMQEPLFSGDNVESEEALLNGWLPVNEFIIENTGSRKTYDLGDWFKDNNIPIVILAGEMLLQRSSRNLTKIIDGLLIKYKQSSLAKEMILDALSPDLLGAKAKLNRRLVLLPLPAGLNSLSSATHEVGHIIDMKNKSVISDDFNDLILSGVQTDIQGLIASGKARARMEIAARMEEQRKMSEILEKIGYTGLKDRIIDYHDWKLGTYQIGFMHLLQEKGVDAHAVAAEIFGRETVRVLELYLMFEDILRAIKINCYGVENLESSTMFKFKRNLSLIMEREPDLFKKINKIVMGEDVSVYERYKREYHTYEDEYFYYTGDDNSYDFLEGFYKQLEESILGDFPQLTELFSFLKKNDPAFMNNFYNRILFGLAIQVPEDGSADTWENIFMELDYMINNHTLPRARRILAR